MTGPKTIKASDLSTSLPWTRESLVQKGLWYDANLIWNVSSTQEKKTTYKLIIIIYTSGFKTQSHTNQATTTHLVSSSIVNTQKHIVPQMNSSYMSECSTRWRDYSNFLPRVLSTSDFNSYPNPSTLIACDFVIRLCLAQLGADTWWGRGGDESAWRKMRNDKSLSLIRWRKWWSYRTVCELH